jgi:HEAT repeat protein
VADPVIEGRSLVVEAIRALAIACRAWAAYPSDHPNVARAVGAAQTRVSDMLAAHGSVAIGIARNHLRVGAWTLESPQSRALAQALYRRQATVLRMDPGVQDDELRALVQWLAGPAVPLEPGSAVTGPPGLEAALHIHVQPLDYSAIRLTDRMAEPAQAPEEPAPPSVSLADRLLTVILEWGASGETDWSGDAPDQGSTPPADLGMVDWLRDFLEAEAARERGDATAPDGSPKGIGSGEPGSATGEGVGGTDHAADSGAGRDAPGRRADGTSDAPDLVAGPGISGPGTARGHSRGPAESVTDRTPAPAGSPATVPGDSASSGAGGLAGSPDVPPDDTRLGGSGSYGPAPPQLLVRLAEATTAYFEGLPGAGRVQAARQTAHLIMRLPESLRDGLMRATLRVVATDPAGEKALQAFTSSMAAHPVLRVMRQLGAEGVPLSRHAQRLVELLATTPVKPDDEDTPSARDLEILHGELVTLFREEDIDRYNPEDHLALLARAMLAWPTGTAVALGTLETLGDRVASLTEDAVGRQLTETFLDLLGRYGDDKTGPVLSRLEQLVQGALSRGSLDEAAFAIQGMARLATDETVPEPTRVAMRGQLDRLAGAETLSVLAASLGATSGPAAVRLVRLLGPSAIRSLLQVLVEEKVRVRRRRVFDLLSALGTDVVPEATPWLMDPNWYVVRNIVALLRTVGDRSSLPSVRRLTGHADLRVRLEALRSLLEFDPTVGHGYLLSAIADRDPRVATAAVELAGQRGGATMVEPLLGVLTSWDPWGRRRGVRLAALEALGRMGRPEALPRLARFFRERWVPFPSLAERRAAYESLEGYPSDARTEFVMRGLRARDHEIRAVCEYLRSAR